MPTYFYKISFVNSPKVYIGRTNNTRRRWNEHRAKSNRDFENRKLYNALRKYGVESAIFDVIETVHNCTKEQMNSRERQLIEQYDSFNNGYNSTIFSGGHNGLPKEKHPLWGKKHSKETRNKMCLSHRDISGKNHPNYGKFGADNPKSKIWKIYRTDNRIDVTNNRREWSIDNGYSDGNLSNLYNGRLTKYRDIIKVEIL